MPEDFVFLHKTVPISLKTLSFKQTRLNENHGLESLDNFDRHFEMLLQFAFSGPSKTTVIPKTDLFFIDTRHRPAKTRVRRLRKSDSVVTQQFLKLECFSKGLCCRKET